MIQSVDRGNQRDRDRARALARAGGTANPAKDKDGLNAAGRKERCVSFSGLRCGIPLHYVDVK